MADQCYRHTQVETSLSCGRCGKAICINCVVQHPVGIRCPDCGKPTVIPMWEIGAGAYFRATSAALLLSIASLALIAWILWYIGGALGYYISVSVIVGLGFLVGRAVHWSTGGKRGRKLQWVAGTATVATGIIVAVITGINLSVLVATAVATFLAVRSLEI